MERSDDGSTQAGLDGCRLTEAFRLGEEDEGEASRKIMEEWLAEARVDYTLGG